jgi:hypothetical protein
MRLGFDIIYYIQYFFNAVMPKTRGTRRTDKSQNPDDLLQSDNEGNLMLHSKGSNNRKTFFFFYCEKGFSSLKSTDALNFRPPSVFGRNTFVMTQQKARPAHACLHRHLI